VVMNRRLFMTLTAAGLATTSSRAASPGLSALPGSKSHIKAVAFDAFPIFDPRPVFALADQMFPGSGLSDERRTRQFEYTWLRVAVHRYSTDESCERSAPRHLSAGQPCRCARSSATDSSSTWQV
jgi:hypothetical protein